MDPSADHPRITSWRSRPTAVEPASFGDRGPATALRVAGPLFVSTGYDPGVDDNRTPVEADDQQRRTTPILSADVTEAPVDWSAPGADGSGSRVGQATLANGMVIAGVGTRIAAFFVDFFILGCASVAISLLSGDLIADDLGSYLVATILSAVLAVGYFAVAWISPWSATPGQRLAGLRVVDADTLLPIDASQALIRSLALGAALNLVGITAPFGQVIGVLLFLYPFFLVASTIYGARHQGFHDRWTRTLVVRPVEAGAFPLTIGCFLIVLIILAAPLVIAATAGSGIQQWLQQLPSPAPR
jgi:uncharacterized RDD family membrane protein YckC